MRCTHITTKDKRFMKLASQVQKAIKNPKEWREFKKYCDFYFKKLPTHENLANKKE